MNVNQGFGAVLSSVLKRGGRAVGLALLVVGAAPAQAEHFYGAWVQEFDRTSTQGQTAAAVATDSRGNVIVVGNSPSSNGTAQFYTAKYDGLDGHLVWSRILGVTQTVSGLATPVGPCVATAVAVDDNDSVIVTGGGDFSFEDEDFLTVKYNSAGGATWARVLAGGSGQDEARKVVIDQSNDVIVTGVSNGTGGAQEDFLTGKYSPTGALVFNQRYARVVATINGAEIPTGLAADGTGNIWVTGSSEVNGTVSFVTVKYSPLGVLQFPAKVYTSPGAQYGATGIAVDSAGSAFVTGRYTDLSHYDGFYTVKYNSAGTQIWEAQHSSGFEDNAGGAQSIAVDPSGDVIVTGAIVYNNTNGSSEALTIKYPGDAIGTASPLWMRVDTGLSAIQNEGFPSDGPTGSTLGSKVVADGAGNVVVAGYSAKDGTTAVDFYVAKYNGLDGTTLFSGSYGGDFDGPDLVKDVAVDASGNIALAGTEERAFGADENGNGGEGLNGIATLKIHRILAETGDDLPAGTAARKISVLNAPALADNGGLAARITLAQGKTKLGALLTQVSAGGTQLPAVQKQPVSIAGSTQAAFASFGDPVIAPDGEYAFPAVLSGVPASKKNTVWTNLGGTLHLALQQGEPVPGISGANVASVMSLAVRNSQLLALVKVSGKASENMVLLGLNPANSGTKLLRTGDPVSLDGHDSFIKTLTVLSPSAVSPGDGRWQGDGTSVVKAGLLDKRTVLYKVTSGGVPTRLLSTNQPTPAAIGATTTWKTFGLPAIGTGGLPFAALGTINAQSGVTASNNRALVYSADGSTFTLVARVGSPAPISTGINYSGLSDPLVNSAGDVAVLATLKGTKVTGANNRALLFGGPTNLQSIARTGDKATDESGAPTTATYSAISVFALPGGTPGAPVFTAKIKGAGVTAKNNSGVWGRDSSGAIRQLLRTGDHLGEQTVSKFVLLTAVPKAFAAARSFNDQGSVVALVSFTDHTTGLLEIQVP